MEKKYFKLFMPILLAFSISACGSSNNEHVPPAGTKDLDIAHKLVKFSDGESDDYLRSSGYCNGHPFNVEWNNANSVITDGELNLSISTAPEGRSAPYYGGEYRSKDFFGYGDFGVRMKPAKVVGTASTFFLYTGEWDSETLHPSTGVDDTRNPGNEEGKHDEIDIEFLGKDTTKVQFNYFTNGQGGNEYMYDLGFDASKEYHNYGFRWEEGRITWFVDEKPVYTATKNVPTHPGRMITNYWSGTWQAANWMGTFDGNATENAKYEWFSSNVQGTHTSLEPEPGPAPGDVVTLAFSGDGYVCTSGNGVSTIAYESIQDNSYKNVYASIVVPEGANTLSFDVENKGAENVQFNIDLRNGETSYVVERDDVTYDWYDTGAFRAQYNIGADATRTIKLAFDATAGVNGILMFVNSAWAQTPTTHTNGNIVITNASFSTVA